MSPKWGERGYQRTDLPADGSDGRPYSLSPEARRQKQGVCVPHVHASIDRKLECDRHHWTMIHVVVRWGIRGAWECVTCGEGSHVEDPSNERAERRACLA